MKPKNTPEQIKIVEAMGSRDSSVSLPAAQAYAAAIGPVIKEVLNQQGTASLIYSDYEFNEDDNQSIPLDLFYDQPAEYVKVWAASPIAGGLPTSEIAGVAEMKFSTYGLETAVSFLKKYARKHNLNVLGKTTDRLINETLIKQELQAWSVLLKALGEASSPVNGVATKHTIAAGLAGTFKLDDLSRLITLSRRINQSYSNGTPVAPYSKGVTDIFVSPEIKEDIRAFTYNPMNTSPGPTVAGSTLSNYTATTAVPLPDSVREEIFRAAGTSSLYGINITDLNELGVSQIYNQLFSAYASGNIAPGATTFVPGTHELILAADLTRESALARSRAMVILVLLLM